MDDPRRPEGQPTDPAGGGGAWTPSLGLLAVAVGAVLGAAAWWWSAQPAAPAPSSAPVAATVPAGFQAVPVPVAPAPVAAASSGAAPLAPLPTARTEPQPVARNRDPDGDQTPDLSDYVNPGEQPTMAQVIDRLHQAGVRTGLGAFSPPGTRPPLVGLAVPEDFVLPEGYVRHYQATDDGQRIEAVLMFAPDRPILDAAGRPIPNPTARDRVVPPELAPPGLPARRIVVPPSDTGRPRN